VHGPQVPAGRWWSSRPGLKGIWRMSAQCACVSGCRWPRRLGQTGGHLRVGWAVGRDALAAGKQGVGVLEHDDAVAEQAQSLFGMTRHGAGSQAIRCPRGRAVWLMPAHDAPLFSCWTAADRCAPGGDALPVASTGRCLGSARSLSTWRPAAWSIAGQAWAGAQWEGAGLAIRRSGQDRGRLWRCAPCHAGSCRQVFDGGRAGG